MRYCSNKYGGSGSSQKIDLISVGEPEPTAEEPKLNSPPGAGAGAEIINVDSGSSFGSGSSSFLFIKDMKKFYGKKSSLLKKFILNFYNFNPIRVKYATLHVKKVLLFGTVFKSYMVIFKVLSY